MSLRILFVALLCATGVLSFPTYEASVPTQCIDPTFACQDFSHARLCGVVKSCINDIWSTMAAPDDNEDICTLCKEMVKEARDQLLSNMTQEELKEVFEGSCKLLPLKPVADVCIKLFDEFIPQLVEMLASRMDPNMVCTVSGLCNAVHVPKSKSQNGLKDELVCEFCTNVLEHIKELATTNTTVEEFKTALHNFCNHTGSFSSKCSEFVDDYFDTIFGFIKSLDTHSFCTLIGLCDNQKSSQNIHPMVKIIPLLESRKKIPLMRLKPAKPINNVDNLHPIVNIEPNVSMKKKQNQIETNEIFDTSPLIDPFPLITAKENLHCSMCKAISFYLEKDLNGDKSKVAVERALQKVCYKWVTEYTEQCENIIRHYSVHLAYHIVDGASFDDICFFAKACPIEETGGKELKVTIHGSHKQSDNLICDLCKEAFDELQTELKDPSTKKSVEAMLVQVCNYLPSELRDECNSFIDENLGTVFNILEQELTADNMCPLLKLCPQSEKEKSIGYKKVKDLECDLCKDFVQQLQEKLQTPDVKKSLTDLLEKGCAMLPQEVATECKNFVDQNIDNLINMVVQDLDPTLVCSALKICTNSVKVIKNGLECELCEEVMEKLDEELKDQRTEEAIKEALTKVCGYLPSSISEKCDRFVQQYSTIIIALLADEMDPKFICTQLQLCQASLKRMKVKTIECDVCKEVVTELDNELKDVRTKEAIEGALDKVCSFLPESIASKCKDFVANNAEELITLLAAELSPDMVCGALNICPAKGEELQRWKTKAGNLECEGCQTLLHYIQTLFMDASVQDKIKNTMKKVCKLFPKVYDDNCEAYIEEYGSSLLTILAQEMDPSVVCIELETCPANTTKYQPSLIGNTKSFDMDRCSLCSSVVNYMDKLLELDNVDKDIVLLIEKVCVVFPQAYKDECSSMISTYGPYIIQMLAQLADSKQICRAIDLCPPVPGHVHLIGGRKCTFGPSYWCQSSLHASACNARVYCNKNGYLA